jgi:hypothetical protein
MLVGLDTERRVFPLSYAPNACKSFASALGAEACFSALALSRSDSQSCECARQKCRGGVSGGVIRKPWRIIWVGEHHLRVRWLGRKYKLMSYVFPDAVDDFEAMALCP